MVWIYPNHHRMSPEFISLARAQQSPDRRTVRTSLPEKRIQFIDPDSRDFDKMIYDKMIIPEK